MKVLVFTHELGIGGTQVNSIDLAASLRDLHGWDVTLFSTPGPMVKYAHEKRLSVLSAPYPTFTPSPRRMSALREAVRRVRPNVLHVWDWWQCLDAYYAVHLPMRLPMIVSDMMMTLTRVLPKELCTTFGTPELVDQARATGRRHVDLILPPVDVHLNAPDSADPSCFRNKYAVDSSEVLLVTVSRLAEDLKSESLLRTIDAVRVLGHELPVRFAIVGDGNARGKLEKAADAVNAELGRKAVFFTGPLIDPRPAYAAANVVLGMGGSALRAMAMRKPVIIMGEKGFSAPFTPQTAESFYYKGIYGLGNGTNMPLVDQIRELSDPNYASTIGNFSHDFVVSRFSLEVISARLASLCRKVAAENPPFHLSAVDGLRTTAVYLRERKFLWRWGPRTT